MQFVSSFSKKRDRVEESKLLSTKRSRVGSDYNAIEDQVKHSSLVIFNLLKENPLSIFNFSIKRLCLEFGLGDIGIQVFKKALCLDGLSYAVINENERIELDVRITIAGRQRVFDKIVRYTLFNYVESVLGRLHDSFCGRSSCEDHKFSLLRADEAKNVNDLLEKIDPTIINDLKGRKRKNLLKLASEILEYLNKSEDNDLLVAFVREINDKIKFEMSNATFFVYFNLLLGQLSKKNENKYPRGIFRSMDKRIKAQKSHESHIIVYLYQKIIEDMHLFLGKRCFAILDNAGEIKIWERNNYRKYHLEVGEELEIRKSAPIEISYEEIKVEESEVSIFQSAVEGLISISRSDS